MSKLPRLTNAQRLILRDIINVGEGSIVRIYSILPHRGWGPFGFDASDGTAWWVNNQYATSVKALIRRGILASKISDEEFAIQYALGSLDRRQYLLTDIRKWKDSLRDMDKQADE